MNTANDALDFGQILSGTVISHTATDVVVEVLGLGFDLKGVGFGGFDGLGLPTAGTLNELDISQTGDPVAAISGLKIGVPLLRSLMETHDGEGIGEAMFGGHDKMIGAGGDDGLYGHGGPDVLRGGLGADTLDGGSGTDTLTGGGGADTFHFTAAADSTVAAPDLITDLHAEDSIDLSLIDADITTQGQDDAFTIVAKFNGTAGQLTIGYDKATHQTVIQGDTDGDGHANLEILVHGHHTDFTNFVL